jgi:outer membrane immunogenic protein
MRRILAAIALLVAATAASAQQTYNWSGLYAGIHAGATADASTVYTYTVAGNFEPADRPRPTEPEGLFLGGHVGYLYQFGSLVAGVEAGATQTALHGVLKENPPPTGNDYQTRTDTGPLYMVTGRLGVAWDRLLMYGKAGWAWTDYDFEATFFNKDGPLDKNGIATNGSQVRIANSFSADAPVWGLGAEYALARHVTVGIEYMRMDFGTSDVTTLTTTNSGIKTEKIRASHEIDTVTARVNFRF